MGLDMYLSAKRYIGGWNCQKDNAESKQYTKITKALGLARCEGSPSLNIDLHVAYWRKANAIYKWFVDNVQGGEDHNCEEHEVTREQIERLRDLCREILAQIKTHKGEVRRGERIGPDTGGEWVQIYAEGEVMTAESIEVAAKRLPTTSGFFFGSTDYDDGYVYDLKNTEEQLTAILESPAFAPANGSGFGSWTLFYQASW